MDAFLSDEEMHTMPREVLHIPTCMGAVVVAYNLPGVKELNLTGDLLARIYLNEITQWNDPAIVEVNPNVKLPKETITPVYRSDGSGTTYVFSDYMSKVSSAWLQKIGRGKSLKWPKGMAAKGNPGVASVIKQTSGAIGYIGSEYSFFSELPMARIQNAAGHMIEASQASIAEAASDNIPSDIRVMITDSENPKAYPISCLTWLLAYKEQKYAGRSLARAKATKALLEWMLSERAQSEAESVHYSPLPKSMIAIAKNALDEMTYDGKPIVP